MKNNNLGNLSASHVYGGLAWRPPWFEVGPGSSPRMLSLHEAMLKGTAPSAFRAYLSPEEGALDFAKQLLHTFPEVVEAANQHDPDVFRQALAVKYSHDYRNTKATATFAALQKELGLVVTAAGGAGALVFLLFWLARKLLLKA